MTRPAIGLDQLYLLHQHSHHRVERWLPTFVIGYGALGAIYNSTQIHQANGSWRY